MSVLHLKDLNTGEWLSIDSLQGQSAYDVAVEQGFQGTEQEWLASLVGSKGPAGPQGEQGPAGPMGQDGKPGASGVYVGEGDMPEDCNVQIDPAGEVLNIKNIIQNALANVSFYVDVTKNYELALANNAVSSIREYLWTLSEGNWSLVDGDEKYYLQVFLGDFSAEPITHPKRILVRCWEFLDIEIHSGGGHYDTEPYLKYEGETGALFNYGNICNPTDLFLHDGSIYLSHRGLRFGKGVKIPEGITEDQVAEMIEGSKPDLTGFATEDYVDNAIANIDIPTGGGSAEWELIADLTTTEEATLFSFDTPSGYKKINIFFLYQTSTTNTANQMYYIRLNGLKQSSYQYGINGALLYQYSKTLNTEVEVFPEKYVTFHTARVQDNQWYNTPDLLDSKALTSRIQSITKVEVGSENNKYTFGSGTRVIIWGVK